MNRMRWLLAGGVVLWAASAVAETPLERGRYLAEAVMACDLCHSPPGPQGRGEKRFSGGPQTFATPAYTVKGANISSDPETGIGSWSQADLERALTEGVRPSGVPIAPQMPYAFYRILTPSDLNALATFIRAAAPVKNSVQAPDYRSAWTAESPPGADHPIGDEVPSDPVKRGFYLATLAHCMECHARTPEGRQDFVHNWGKGGSVMRGPYGEVRVANITNDPVKGVGAWTDDQLKDALTKGVSRDGRKLAPPMARQEFFSRMTPQDLDALVAWIRTIPAN